MNVAASKTRNLLPSLEIVTDPARARLLLLIDAQELTVSELVAITRLPQPTVSRHLRKLAESGWATAHAESTNRWYRINGAGLGEHLTQLWGALKAGLSELHEIRRDAERLARILTDRRKRSREFFSTSAARWDRLRSELFGSRCTALALAAWLDPDWVVGDLGCGTGEVTMTIAPFVNRIVAVDAAPEMIEAARVRAGDCSNIEFQVGELEALPIPRATLDAAVISLVLHHVADPLKVLQEARRALKPDSPLAIIDMVPHNRESYREEMGHLWLGFSRSDLAGLLRAAGFKTNRSSYQLIPVDHDAAGPGLFVAVAR